MSDFVVNDRVQWEDRNTGEVTGGIIVSVVSPKRMKTDNYWRLEQAEQDEMITHANVKWDDGTEDAVDIEDLDPEDSPIEREFRIKSKEISEAIDKKIDEASAALGEAVKLSEKHGIPFRSNISFLDQGYSPSTTRSIYSELDKEFVRTITGVYNEYDGEGWEHSAVCY